MGGGGVGGGGGGGFDTRRAGVADLGISRKKGAARRGSVQGLNEAQLHSAPAVPAPPLSQESAASGAAPIIPAHFLPRCRGGRGAEKEWEEADKWTGSGRGGGVTAEWSHLCNLRRSSPPLPRLPCTKTSGSAEKRREITARTHRQLTTLGSSQAERNPTSPLTGEWNSGASNKAQPSDLSNTVEVIIQ